MASEPATPTSAAQAAQVVANATPGTPAASTPAATAAQMNVSAQVSSLEQLKNEAPQVYNQMMLGIATNIINDMQKRQNRLQQMQQDYRNQTS